MSAVIRKTVFLTNRYLLAPFSLLSRRIVFRGTRWALSGQIPKQQRQALSHEPQIPSMSGAL